MVSDSRTGKLWWNFLQGWLTKSNLSWHKCVILGRMVGQALKKEKNRMLNNDALTVRANDITKLRAHNFRNHFDRFQSRSF